MAEADRDPTASHDPRYFPTGAVIERPVGERPKHDTVDGIIEWLAGPAQHIPSLGDEFDELPGGCWRQVFLCYARPCSFVQFALNILAQTSCGGERRGARC